MLFEFLIYLIVLIFSYCFGLFYNRIVLKQRISAYSFSSIEYIVINILVGVFLTVVITANIASGFTTTYFLFFLLIVSPIYLLRNKAKLKLTNEFMFKKKHLFLLGFIPLFFLYHQLLFNRFLDSTPFYDFIFQSKISSAIILNGTESLYTSSEFYGVLIKPHLYHYFELWFNGIISKTFSFSEYQVMLYVTFPIFHLLVFSTLFLIFKTIFKSFYLSLSLAFGFLFGIKIFFNISGSFYELIETYRGLPYSMYYKLLTIYLFILLAYFFYLKKINWLATLSICILLVIYPTTIPGIIFLAIFIFGFELYKNRKISNFSLAVFLVIFYLVCFQKIMHFDTVANLSFHLYSIKQYIVLFIESLIKIFIEHYLVILLLITLLIKDFRHLINNQIIIFVFVALFGCIGYVYFNPPGIPDLNQIITNLSSVLLLILSIELLQLFIHSKKIIYIVFITFFIGCYNIYFNFEYPNRLLLGKQIKHSDSFVKSLESIVFKNRYNNFGSISAIQPNVYFYHTSMKFNYLLELKDLKTPLEINVLFESENNIKEYKKMNKYYPPNKFFSKYSNSTNNIYDYLKLNHIKYVLVEKTEKEKVHKFLNNHCALVLEDGNTHDALYKLN